MGVTMALLLTAALAWGEVYRWVDENGVVTFKDYPPPSWKKGKVKVYGDTGTEQTAVKKAAAEATTRDSGSRTAATATAPASGSEYFSGRVELYITDWCGYCKRAVAYMKAKNIPYVAYDIEKDEAARKRFQQLGGSGVPLIMVGNRRMSGFSPETLERYLGNR
jgi:glutaredoxin-like YruB-family protein